MRSFIIFLTILTNVCTYSQNKGVKELPTSLLTEQAGKSKLPVSSTYAVVVGISDYQDKDIPDLRFADKDAQAFANFLRSPAGGSLDGEHMQVLINNQATAGRIAEALDALIEKAKKDDQVIIYFSGHGDVEGKKLTQPGFLLCWDAPSRVYMGGGTYSLSFLQEVVSTLSVTNQAKVVVITDACHAGKLAGSQIGGAQLTTANLAKQYANEIKILSCQPNEFSLEGEQWGGGRGVFSYHLVDGLFGLADRNNDSQITLGEIDRYLEDHVTAEAAPQSQVPILLGNKTDRLATVNSNILAELKKDKTGNMAVFAATESRGFEEEILSKVDTSIREMYKHFKLAVLEKRFFVPAGSSAEEYYVQLEKVELLAPLRGIMKRNYAAALQDDAQQVMNKWLKTDISEIYLSKTTRTEKYQAYPNYLERAAILLGKDHYMYPLLMARMHFFRGYLLALSSRNPDKQLASKALSEFRSALQWQPDLPHAYWQMSNVYGYNLLQADSAEICAKLAIELQPTWVLPNTNLAFLFSEKLKLFERAIPFLENANRLEPESAIVKNIWGIYHINRKQYPEAEKYLKLAIEADSTYGAPLANLALIYRIQKRQLESELYFKKAINIDPTYEGNYGNLAGLYHDMQRYPEAEQQFITALKLDSASADFHFGLGNVYASMDRDSEAEVQYKKALQLDSLHIQSLNNLGQLYDKKGRFQDAEILYKKILQFDTLNYNVHLNLSLFYLRNQKWNQVIDICKKMQFIDSARTDAYIFMGSIYCDHLKRYPEAEQQFKKAIALDSTSIDANYNLGQLYIATMQFEEAEQQFKKVLRLSPYNADVHWSLGNVYSSMQRFDLAEQEFDKALQLDNKHSRAYIGKANIFYATGKVLEAEKVYEEAIQSGIKDIGLFMQYGWLCQELEKFDIAANQFKAILAIDSTNAGAYVNLGEIFLLAEKRELIVPAFLKALELQQAYAAPYALNGLAVYYLGENNFRLSEEYVNKAIEMYPEFPPSYRNLGELYMKTSRKNQARPLFEKALSIDPEDGQAYYLLAILAAQDHQYDEAFKAMEQALILNYKKYNKWISNEDLNVLHQDARWKTLMQKHFPDKFKD